MASHIWNFLQEAIPKAEKMRFSRHELTDPKGLRGMMAEVSRRPAVFFSTVQHFQVFSKFLKDDPPHNTLYIF